MKAILCLAIYLFAVAMAQNVGTNKQEYHIPVSFQECYGPGNCQSKSGEITLDANWRWAHVVGGYQNCYTGNQWDKTLCPDEETCTKNCAVDGVEYNDWGNPYGVFQTNGGISMKLVTHGQYGDNIGARVYLLEGTQYKIFKLKNKEFAFDVDVSNLPCGVNGALYFVEMSADGGSSKHSDNKAGAKYGTGYCDAQCPHDMKFIYGRTNNKEWQANPKDKNSGIGHYGTCCAELDIWEANMYAAQFTVHACSKEGYFRCEGVNCGDNSKGERYKGVCDKDGCDFNSYRMGDKSFFGPGAQFKVDTTKPFTVVTQFLTTDGTDKGDLKEIRRFYVQGGKKIQNSKAKISGLTHDSISDATCYGQKAAFDENNHFSQLGGLKTLGQAMDRGLVLVMSIWDDHDVNMLWLDSDYPLDKPNSEPGVQRGPCSRTSGDPKEVESKYGDSSVKYMNIKVGPIGSTNSAVGFLEE